MVDLAQILNIINNFGVVGLLVLILAGGMRRWWVWGWTYDDIVAERDTWKDLALSGTSLAERAVNLADTHRRSGP